MAIWLVTTATPARATRAVAAPLVLGEKHPAKLCKGACTGIVQRPQDKLAVLDRESDDSSLELYGDLMSRNEHERAFLGTEKVSDALGVGLDGYGQLLSAIVLGDREHVIPHVVVPDRVTHFERALGIAELSTVWKADDQRRHSGARYLQAWSARVR